MFCSTATNRVAEHAADRAVHAVRSHEKIVRHRRRGPGGRGRVRPVDSIRFVHRDELGAPGGEIDGADLPSVVKLDRPARGFTRARRGVDDGVRERAAIDGDGAAKLGGARGGAGEMSDVPRESNDAGSGRTTPAAVGARRDREVSAPRCSFDRGDARGRSSPSLFPSPSQSPRPGGRWVPGGVARRRVPANRGSRGRPRRARRRVPRRPRRRICAGRPARRTTTLGVTRGRRTRTRRAGPARAWTRGWSLDDSASRRTSLTPRGPGWGRSGAVGGGRGAPHRAAGDRRGYRTSRGDARRRPRAPPRRERARRGGGVHRDMVEIIARADDFPQISISARETMRAERAHPRDRDPRVDEDGDHF